MLDQLLNCVKRMIIHFRVKELEIYKIPSYSFLQWRIIHSIDNWWLPVSILKFFVSFYCTGHLFPFWRLEQFFLQYNIKLMFWALFLTSTVLWHAPVFENKNFEENQITGSDVIRILVFLLIWLNNSMNISWTLKLWSRAEPVSTRKFWNIHTIGIF